MNRCIVLAAGLLMGMVLTPIQAQETVLAELYGQGVHAYYSGDYRMAHQFLTSAIDQGSRDPRAYYFRGLTYASLGRPTEADADFRTGAQLETQKADRIYPVAESLQRVQGRMRLQLERHRQIARLTSRSQGSTAQQARFQDLKRAESEVLRDPARPAPAAPDAIVTPPAAEPSDPFTGGPAAAPEAAPEKPAEPMADPAAPAPAADPFSTPAADPAAPAAMPPAEDAKTDPFTDDKPATPPATPATPPADKPAENDPFAP